MPRESRRGHRRSSRLGFQAARRLPVIHHWRHDTTSFGSDLFSDPSRRHRCRGNPPRRDRLWFRTSAATYRFQSIGADQDAAEAPPTDTTFSHSPHATCAADSSDTDPTKAGPFDDVFHTD